MAPWMQVEQVIRKFHRPLNVDAENCFLLKHNVEIEKLFNRSSIELVMTALEDSITEFGRETFRKIHQKCSPLSLKVTFKALNTAKDFSSLKEAIKMELRLATRMVVDFPDFATGVRSLLVDKNSKPQWSHSVVTQVDDRVVKNIFAPFSQPELELNL
eukprot:TRINITY_DN12346_c0_g1_i1.p1 TRINITY_DN12346_c0_g1~~TRINITY_DN12346_c0_g1_i1.p1  ORF type:complete len:158 (+),score=42.88 TRINITY_DN12346_c0_g1_i1:720-1193(+)